MKDILVEVPCLHLFLSTFLRQNVCGETLKLVRLTCESMIIFVLVL